MAPENNETAPSRHLGRQTPSRWRPGGTRQPARRCPASLADLFLPPTRLIHPVWLFRPVPKGFWAKKENRLDYLLWLGGRLGYRQAQDWYQVTARADFRTTAAGAF